MDARSQASPMLRGPRHARVDWRPDWTDRPLPLRDMLGSLRRGRADPAFREVADGSFWLAMANPEGSATLHVESGSDGTVRFEAYGPGCRLAVRSGPRLLGSEDDVSGFEPIHRLLARTWHRLEAHRLPRTDRLWESLLPAVLEQRVTGKESRSAWRLLLTRFGEPAPTDGSAGVAPESMYVPPRPRAVRAIPDWEWHRMGVDGSRRRTVRAVAVVGDRLDDLLDAAHRPDIGRALLSVPGIGPWTVAETMQRVRGDADAVSVGDYHLSSFVGWALVGRPVDDSQMLSLLEPYAGQRYRAIRLLKLSGYKRARFGPRLAIQDMRRF